MSIQKDYQKIFIEAISDLTNWLAENHSNKESVWLVRWKKGVRQIHITYDEIVDELICYGWIDSLPRKLNDEQTMLLISPRKPKSNWSGANKSRFVRLEKESRILPPGRRVVDIAKENGAWDFLNDVENLILPDDLKEALAQHKNASYYFNRFPNSSKRGILEWIKNAKQPVTRSRRIAETAAKASNNLKANHPKGRDAGPKT